MHLGCSRGVGPVPGGRVYTPVYGTLEDPLLVLYEVSTILGSLDFFDTRVRGE